MLVKFKIFRFDPQKDKEPYYQSFSVEADPMERLLDYTFEWVLPGHGRPVTLTSGAMRARLQRCIAWMKSR